jgi:oleate hydratase
MMKYLESRNVQFQYGTKVTNVEFSIKGDHKVAKRIICERAGKKELIDLIEDDLVFVTNGSCTENSSLGDDTHAPALATGVGGCWELWRNIAKQDPSFGRPDKFCTDTKATNWESATITTLDDRVPPYIEKICKRDPFSGKVVTGGIVTAKDSKWLISYTLNRQPHFKEQPKNQLVVWVYGLFSDVPGDYIKKPMKECTGVEIAEEWLYHLGVPVSEIHDMASKSTHCIPCMLPYITAFFMPRTKGDRPKVVPDGAVNFAFIGQFADTVRDTVFTTEYSVRTAMEAVYTLLNVDRGVPEVFASCYDVRVLLDSTSKMMDGKKLGDVQAPLIVKMIKKKAAKKVSGTVIEDLLRRYSII